MWILVCTSAYVWPLRVEFRGMYVVDGFRGLFMKPRRVVTLVLLSFYFFCDTMYFPGF